MFRSFDRGSRKSAYRPILWFLLACVPLACAADNATGSSRQSGTQNAPAASADKTQDSSATDAGDNDKKYYDVDCSKVDENGEKYCLTDKATYVGWRTFHSTCHVCHGQNAVGSSFAPSLLHHIDKKVFVDTVTNGRTGQIGVMPAWGKNPNVKDFIDELYAYQQARADGVLLPGRPKRKD